MKRITLLITILSCIQSYSQKVLSAWGQKDIENHSKEQYDIAQKLTPTELLSKNLTANSWVDVFLTLNASVNNYSKDAYFLKELALQITNTKETKLQGTSRLIIWDRIITGDIIFEGKGLVIENDLFKVGGRANQILQNLSGKNFGIVTNRSTDEDLEVLKIRWIDYLSGKSVPEYVPTLYQNSKIPEISSLNAVQALIISLQENPTKQQITQSCLKNVYNLEELPAEKDSPAHFCNPDTYTLNYLRVLFGDIKKDESSNATWWLNYWNENRAQLNWNSEKGIYEIKK